MLENDELHPLLIMDFLTVIFKAVDSVLIVYLSQNYRNIRSFISDFALLQVLDCILKWLPDSRVN